MKVCMINHVGLFVEESGESCVFYRKINKVTVYGRYMKVGQEPVPFLGATRKGNVGTLEGITRFRELERNSFERAGKLKVIGVDYRKIENWYRCSNNHVFGQPNFKFACSKCGERFPIEDTRIEMLHNYNLTDSGRQMLKLGIKATEVTEKNQDKKS